jgi:hypothetical protein
MTAISNHNSSGVSTGTVTCGGGAGGVGVTGSGSAGGGPCVFGSGAGGTGSTGPVLAATWRACSQTLTVPSPLPVTTRFFPDGSNLAPKT